jgi:hypothetical protein
MGGGMAVRGPPTPLRKKIGRPRPPSDNFALQVWEGRNSVVGLF